MTRQRLLEVTQSAWKSAPENVADEVSAVLAALMLELVQFRVLRELFMKPGGGQRGIDPFVLFEVAPNTRHLIVQRFMRRVGTWEVRNRMGYRHQVMPWEELQARYAAVHALVCRNRLRSPRG